MVQDDADKICNGLPRPRRETDRVRVGEGEAQQMERLTDCFWYRVTDWDSDKSCSNQMYVFLVVYLWPKSNKIWQNYQANLSLLYKETLI